jgi:hypothetical protein
VTEEGGNPDLLSRLLPVYAEIVEEEEVTDAKEAVST